MLTPFNSKLFEKLQVYSFDPKQKGSFPTREYKQTYQLWRDVWSDALKNEMNIRNELRSDNFSRMDAVVSLFRGGECVGLFTSNQFNLLSPPDLEDSYFIDWDSNLLGELRNESPIVFTYENFTISPSVRGDGQPLPWKELVLLLGLHRQMEMECPFMIATPRRNRSVQKATKRAGARTLVEDIPYKIPGETVDLIVWDSESESRVWDPTMRELSKKLWKERIEDEKTGLTKLKIVGGTYAA